MNVFSGTLCSLLTILTSAFSLYAQVQTDSLTSPRLNRNGREKAFHYLMFSEEAGPMLSNGTEEGRALISQSDYRAHSVWLGWQFAKSDVYTRLYRFSRFGVGTDFSNFRNMNIGFPRSYFFWLEAPLKYPKAGQKWYFSYRGAFGIAVDFVPYDEDTNPFNNFIGSAQNCFVDLSFSTFYRLTSRFELGASVGFKHYSNGGSTLPNYGINMLPLSVSARYLIDEQKPEMFDPEPLPTYQKHTRLNVGLAIGQKQYERDGDHFLKATLSMNVLRQISYKYRVGGGVDIMYAQGYQVRYPGASGSWRHSISSALVGSWEWMFRPRIYVPIGLGVYLNRNGQNGERTWLYQRVGLRFGVTNNLWLGLTIKAHRGTADYFEWGMGYTFHRDANQVRRK
ncbi:acyloxyacyl hydrolase [Larkinella harenae]